MSNGKRLIDADRLRAIFNPDVMRYFNSEVVQMAIDDAPTVDAVEVTRCRDCYHNERCICVCCEDGEMVLCGLRHKHMDENGFCSEGFKWTEGRRP
jgi:hypothetical protein